MNQPALKIPQGPHVFAAIQGLRKKGFLAYVDELWKRHGDTFQVNLGFQRLFFAMHPDAVRHINITHRQNYEKGQSYEGVRRFLLGEGLVASTGELWKRQRKLMAPFYTPRGVKVYAGLMLQDGLRLRERWEKLAQSGERVDIGDEMMWVTASIILKAMFSTEADEDILSVNNPPLKGRACESKPQLTRRRTEDFEGS